jgi:hypothetical protein
MVIEMLLFLLLLLTLFLINFVLQIVLVKKEVVLLCILEVLGLDLGLKNPSG